MRGIISKEQGPQLEDILKLLSQRERTCRVELVTRRGDVRGSITIEDGQLRNATLGNATGQDALLQFLALDQINFESSPNVEESREDWPAGSTLEAILREADLRQRELRVRSAESARTFRPISLQGNTLEGDLLPEEMQAVKEEIGFFEFYGKEMSGVLDLGKLQSFGYREDARSLVVNDSGNAWTGGVRSGSVPLAQLIDEARS